MGVGVDFWESSYVDGGWGGGVAGDVAGRTALLLEVRRTDNLQRLVGSDPAYSAITLGVSHRW